MSIREFISRRVGRRPEEDNKLKLMEDEIRMQRSIEQKMKSPAERELEDFLERKRQKTIKNEVDKLRIQDTHDTFNDNLMDKKNIFKGHKKIMGDSNMFKMKGTMIQRGGFI